MSSPAASQRAHSNTSAPTAAAATPALFLSTPYSRFLSSSSKPQQQPQLRRPSFPSPCSLSLSPSLRPTPISQPPAIFQPPSLLRPPPLSTPGHNSSTHLQPCSPFTPATIKTFGTLSPIRRTPPCSSPLLTIAQQRLQQAFNPGLTNWGLFLSSKTWKNKVDLRALVKKTTAKLKQHQRSRARDRYQQTT